MPVVPLRKSSIGVQSPRLIIHYITINYGSRKIRFFLIYTPKYAHFNATETLFVPNRAKKHQKQLA
jgi:endonuclease YncB( thermonuclease family)